MRSRLLQRFSAKLPAPVLGSSVAALLVVTECALVYLLEDEASGNIFGVIFMLGVLFVATVWGFAYGVLTALASAVAYVHFHRLETGETVTATWAQNWVAITAFLVVALSASALAQYARSRAAEADLRRREIESSRDELALLTEQQTALRRVATLVARGVPAAEVFASVALELSIVSKAEHASVWRYEPNHTATLLSLWDGTDAENPSVGARFPLEGDNVAVRVLVSKRATRMDGHGETAGPAAEEIRQMGLRSRVGAPVMVNGGPWGFIMVGTSRPEPLPQDTRSRVGAFADLVGTAIANAQARAELTASRVRIVKAADDARRRIERDLHDGAQQRLVSLGLDLRTLESTMPPECDVFKAQIAQLVTDVVAISQDLQELSRGIHPAILSRGGLGPALKTLARRSAIPVDLIFTLDRRLPDPVEVAAYYVVTEALTNAAKHSQASVVELSVTDGGSAVQLSIRDDGIGGADPGKGSGLVGLTDRVEAIGGQIVVFSKPGDGTSILITVPLADGI